MKCASTECQEEANVRVYWPGKTHDYCADCALRAKGAAEAMGFKLTWAVIQPAEHERERDR